MIAAKLEPIYAERAKERMQQGGGDKKLEKAKRKSGVENLPHPIPNGKARDEAGRMLNVSGRSVSHAATVWDKGAKDLIECSPRICTGGI